MQTSSQRKIEAAIHDAIRSRGWSDSKVFETLSKSQEPNEVGTWVWLGAKYQHGSSWTIVGRRRTRGELLQMVQRRTCETLHRWPPEAVR